MKDATATEKSLQSFGATWEIVTGRKFEKRPRYFSCSC